MALRIVSTATNILISIGEILYTLHWQAKTITMNTSILNKISTIMIKTTGEVLYILVGQEGESACVIEGVETREGLCSQMVSGIMLLTSR